jgi:hypothetical protein
VARLIITLVLAFVLVGLLWPVLVRLRRGRVSDDVIRRERRSTFAPIAGCVAVSFLISAALWWLGQ